jgi:hypothetical protein
MEVLNSVEQWTLAKMCKAGQWGSSESESSSNIIDNTSVPHIPLNAVQCFGLPLDWTRLEDAPCYSTTQLVTAPEQSTRGELFKLRDGSPSTTWQTKTRPR